MSELKKNVANGHQRAYKFHDSNNIYRRFTNWLFHIFGLLLRCLFRWLYGVKGESMPSIQNPILLESATSLARKIRTQELSSVQVMEAFIGRIKDINTLLNCVVDERYADALSEAKAADVLIRSGKYTVEQLAKEKPFLGVPISTKNCIAVKGMLHSAGLYICRNRRADQDADAMALMRAAGAIPFALTNVSEVCMWWESNNPVHGRTRNPYDTNRIVGGSSGGEGCLQAAAGSPMGLGSDIGGSVRMPAFFNGVFGHKPTKFIVSNTGQFPMPLTEEQDSFLGIGPLVRYAEDLKPILRIIAGSNAKLLKLDEPVDLSKLKFFYQEHDGGGRFVSRVDQDIVQIMQNIVQHLSMKFNVSMENIQLSEFRQSAILWFANMKDNSGYHFEHQLSNLTTAVNPYMELLKWFFGASKHTFIGLLTAILDKFQCQYGSKKYYHLVGKRNRLRQHMQELLGDNGILIYPTHPTVAPYHNEPIFRPINFSYTGIVNILGFPATAVPLGLGSEGLPIGVQIIANFHQDRLCLAVAEELEKVYGGWTPPPPPPLPSSAKK